MTSLDKANLVGEVMSMSMSNGMVFGFEKIMDFAMDIDKLNLANLVGKVMDKIMEYQIFCQSVQKDKS